MDIVKEFVIKWLDSELEYERSYRKTQGEEFYDDEADRSGEIIRNLELAKKLIEENISVY